MRVQNIVTGMFLIMGILCCMMPVSASVYTISPGDSIQQAIDGAATGDTIVLNPGTYSKNGILITGKSLTFRAADGHNATDTIIDGGSIPPRIFTVEDSSSLTIENLSLRNGRAGNGTGGSDPFWGDGGNGRPGGHGGAVSSGGPVTLISSAITGCIAGKGGLGGDAGFFGDSGDGGDGGSGGAVYTTGSIVFLSSAVSSSSAGAGGDSGRGEGGEGGHGGNGGAVSAGGTVTLTSSTIAGSRAGKGGNGPAAYLGGAAAGGDGGAIHAGGSVSLSSSSINNSAAGHGGDGATNRKGGHGGSGGAVSSRGTVSLSSSSISNCSSGNGGPGGFSGDGGDGGHGGAIHTGGVVSLASSAITGCSAGAGGHGSTSLDGSSHGNGGYGGSGGAIYSPDTVSVTSSTIAHCSAGNGGSGSSVDWAGGDGGHGRPGGNGGAVFSSGNISLVSSSITSCAAGVGGRGGNGGWFHQDGHTGVSGTGGAVYAPSGTIRFSRLAGNNAVGKVVYSSGGTITATPNWWGANNDPSAQVEGPVTYSPWLVLGITASPVYLTTAQTSVIEANLTYDSDGKYHDPAGQKVPFPFPSNLLAPFSHVPNTIPVTYSVTSGSGSVSPGSTVMNFGKSQTLFKPSLGSPASVTAMVDGQAISVIINSIDPVALPAIMAVSPASGPPSGGTRVTISGTGFAGATGVMFGNNHASFSATGDSMIIATSPGDTAGTVDIIVTTLYGASRVVPADRFTYSLPPTTVPTKAPTTKPVPVPVVGCWYLYHSVEGTGFTYTYTLQADGTGWMNSSRTTAGDTDTVSERVQWIYNQQSAVVTVTEANPPDNREPHRWVLTWVKKTEILDGGEKGGVALIFRRVPCHLVG